MLLNPELNILKEDSRVKRFVEESIKRKSKLVVLLVVENILNDESEIISLIKGLSKEIKII